MNPEYHANSYSLMFAYAVRPSCQLDLKLFLCIQWKLSGCAIYGKHLVACLQACDIGLLDMDSQHHTGQLHLSACLYCDNYPPPPYLKGDNYLVASLQACDIGLLLAWSISTMQDNYVSACLFCDS